MFKLHKVFDSRHYRRLSSVQKEELKEAQDKVHQAQQKEPERLREHLETFNDAVIAIIITIIVFQIQPAFKASQYLEFLGNIVTFIIAFFIIADFWYELHLAFSYFIFKPDKITAICDFCLLATLSLLPVMTKWIMMHDSAFAVTNFGIVYFIAQILKVFVQYFGAKPLMRSSQVMNIMMVKTSVHRIILVFLLTIFLILLSLVVPKVAMVLYILIPFISFFKPNNSRGFR